MNSEIEDYKEIGWNNIVNSCSDNISSYNSTIGHGNKFDNNRTDLNIFRDNCFLDQKYIFNRIFLDKNLIMYKNNDFDEFKKIQNLFNALVFE